MDFHLQETCFSDAFNTSHIYLIALTKLLTTSLQSNKTPLSFEALVLIRKILCFMRGHELLAVAE